MSIIQVNPVVVSDRWSEFVEWASRVFDIPVACRFEKSGWARLTSSSLGVTVLDAKHVGSSPHQQGTVLELEVLRVARALEWATAAGASIITEPTRLPTGEEGLHAAIESPQGIVLWLHESKTSEAVRTEDAHTGPIHFTVDRFLKAPPERVFESITRAHHLEAIFVDRADRDITGPGTITWSWEAMGDSTLHVLELRVNEYLSFRWLPGQVPYQTRTQFSLIPRKGGTHLSITESGWDADTRGLKSAFSHCEGWSTFAANVGMYLEHGVSAMKPKG